jgi:chorismate mutase/prephenate dehydratase
MNLFSSIYYLGPQGTFSEHLANTHREFEHLEKIPVSSITQIYLDVISNTKSLGLIPIENSTEGSVNESLNGLIDYNIEIVDELNMKIEHCLFSIEKTTNKIKKIYAHPQSIGQCNLWLHKHLPSVELIPTSSNGQAIQLACNENNTAVIAGKHNQWLSLNLLCENIQNLKENTTRFNVITAANVNVDIEYDCLYKTSIAISLDDDQGAGSLIGILRPFEEKDIPLTKLVSRPTNNDKWHYIFFIDFVSKYNEINDLLDLVKIKSSFFKSFGSYKISDTFIA